MKLLQQLKHHSGTALCDLNGVFSYKELEDSSNTYAAYLCQQYQLSANSRIALLIPSSKEYVISLLAIWKLNAMAIPLCVSHSEKEWEYMVTNAEADIIICNTEFKEQLNNICSKHKIQLETFYIPNGTYKLDSNGAFNNNANALMIYTSGTTSLPKGAVSTFNQVDAQISKLIEAWEWSDNDKILNPLPLHHVHGLINILLCSIYSGAQCTLKAKLKTEEIIEAIRQEKITLFMAVPTVYYKLVENLSQLNGEELETWKASAQKLRVYISGSAALPVTLHEAWQKLCGHTILERYGMTEIGMAISNPYRGTRKVGYIGLPLPKVQACLKDEEGNDINEANISGEIHIKSPSVFKEYWNKTEKTAEAFTHDGWFKTGDIAIKDDEGYYKILGRSSIDIIKSGGYKLSALEIEDVIRQHPQISDCAVVGLDDDKWGQIVAVSLRKDNNMTILSVNELQDWLADKIAAYKIPRQLIYQDDFPRNAMGKVQKKKIPPLFNK